MPRWFLIILIIIGVLNLLGCGHSPKRRSHFDPYTVNGRTYYPLRSAHGFKQVGYASWYGPKFHGKKTASGERYNQEALTCAHTVLPLGTKIKVTNLENHLSLFVRVNDRGPFTKNRVIDVSKAAAQKLDFLAKGRAKVRLEYVEDQELTPVKVDYGIYIQLGSYKNPKNAAKVRARLARSGFESRIFKTPEGLFNVQAGPLEDAALEESLASLSQDYPGAFIIKP